jgi:protein translocase SecG subunit
MLKIIWLILSLFLILLVLIRIPNSGGITNFSINNNLIGSSNSTERFLNKLTWLFITLYFLLVLKFNIYI